MSVKSWRLVLCLLAVVTLAACGGGDDKEKASKEEAPGGGTAATQQAAQVRRGGSLVVTLTENPQNFDPMVRTDVHSGAVVSNVYEALVEFDEELKPHPWLAERIEQPDNVTYIFHLRKGVKFHDGTEMDAEAVKFSIDRVRSFQGGPSYADAQTIADTVVVDKHTVKVVIKEPDAAFLNYMNGRPGTIVSPTAIKNGGPETLRGRPVGTGAFKFVEWKADSHVRVERFDGYWRQGTDGKALPYLDKVEWRVMTEPTNRLTALQTGDVHIAQISEADLPAVKNDKNLVWKQQPGYRWEALLLSVTKPPFDTKALRQALAYGIDREEIVRTIYEGNREVAHSPVPPPMKWARDPDFKPYSYNPAKVREKLAEGGRPNGYEFTGWFRAGSSEWRRLAELMQAQLARVNIKMNIEFADYNGVMIPRARNQEPGAYAIGYSPGLDPDRTLFPRFHSTGGFNYMKYSNPQVDSMLNAAKRSTNLEERAFIYKQVVPLIMDDAPAILTIYEVDQYTGHKKVQGWGLGPRLTTGYSEYWLSE